MKRDVLDATDQLRTELGLFYWTIRHNGEVHVAAQQLQTVVRLIEHEMAPWCLTVPQSLFARWSQLQLTRLLGEARKALKRLNYALPLYEHTRSAPPASTNWHDEHRGVSLYGPLV